MPEGLLSLILDGVVIVLLAATVFFAARLSLHLKEFRNTRQGFDTLIRDLTGNIDKAERAIEGLRENARESGRNLQTLINQAQALSDELQIMHESGDSLASRLEKLAGNRAPASPSVPVEIAAAKTVEKPRPPSTTSFMIQDREFDEGRENEFPIDDENDFQSRAEKELFDALQGRRKGKGL